MVLQKQVIPVTLAGGLDTKTDPKQVQPGKLLIADNVVMQKTGELSKVDGTTTLTNGVFGGGPITSGKQLSVLGNELCLASNDYFYSYGNSPGAWNKKGRHASCIVSSKPVTSGTVSLKSPVAAAVNNVAMYAWMDPAKTSPSGIVVFTLIDQISGAVIIPPTQVPNSLSSPRLIVQGQYLCLSFLNNGALIFMVTIDSLNPASQTLFQVTAGGGYNANYDICPFLNGFAIVYSNTAGDLFGLVGTPLGSVIVSATNLGINVGALLDYSLILFPGDSASTLGMVFYSSVASGLYHMMFTTTFGVYKPYIQLQTGPRSRFSAVCYNGISEVIYSTSGGADPASFTVGRAVVTLATNTFPTPTSICRGAVVTSRCFRVDGNTLFMASYDNYYLGGTSTDAADQPLQTTHFLIDSEGNTQACILPGKTGNLTYQFANIAMLGSQKVLIPVLQKGRLLSEVGRLFNVDTVSAATLDFSAMRFAPGQVLSKNLYLQGGYLKTYDGVGPVEAGFHLWPDYKSTEGSSAEAKGGAGTGNIEVGIYLYRAVYEWRDANGQLHQSAPTFPPRTISFNTGTNSVALKYRALAFTDKRVENGRNDVSIVLYRTKNGGTTYYRVTPATNPVLNTSIDRAAGFSTLVDRLDDATLGQNQILYTVGGELENVNAPAPGLVLCAKNRIFTVSGEDPSALYYSKQIVVDQIPGFSDSLRLAVNPQFGDITALGVLDDKIVIFKSSTIYILAGDGPLPNGQQDTFSEPAKLASDVGCSNPSSVVETPLGLMFQSGKGIYLLDRSLSVQYIGAAVENYNNYTVTGAYVLAYANEVRFSTLEGLTLIFDYEQNTWTNRTNETAISAVSWQSKGCFLRSNGLVSVESRDQVATDGTPVLSKIKTSFYSFASLQGFQRVWRILVLGKFIGNHVLKVTVFTDYKNTADDVFYIAIGDSTFVSSGPVQAITTQSAIFTGSAADNQYQFSVKPRIQKCESISIQIEDLFPTAVGTKAFNISNVSLEVGSKGVSNRLSATTTLAKG